MAQLKVTDDMICNAASHWQVAHADAPTEAELVQLRDKIAHFECGDIQMLSLHWLRNRFVSLRKSRGLKTVKPLITMEMF